MTWGVPSGFMNALTLVLLLKIEGAYLRKVGLLSSGVGGGLNISESV